MLKFRFPGKRIRFTDAQRVALVRKDKVIGRKALMELETIVSPDALMRCHRKLIAQNWMHRNRRERVCRKISQLIVHLAVDNPDWGYTRIYGVLTNLDPKAGKRNDRKRIEGTASSKGRGEGSTSGGRHS